MSCFHHFSNFVSIPFFKRIYYTYLSNTLIRNDISSRTRYYKQSDYKQKIIGSSLVGRLKVRSFQTYINISIAQLKILRRVWRVFCLEFILWMLKQSVNSSSIIMILRICAVHFHWLLNRDIESV